MASTPKQPKWNFPRHKFKSSTFYLTLLALLGLLPYSQCQEISKTFSVVENSDLGTVIDTVADQSGYTYSFLSDSPYVALDTSSGELTTTQSIDREAFSNGQLVLVIKAQNSLDSSSYLISTVINILDLNDNHPSFLEPYFNYTITENVVQVQPFTLSATDPDRGPNGTDSLIYSLVSGDDNGIYWRLESNSTLKAGLLYLKKPVDREEEPSFSLEVQARDQGNPPKIGTVRVNIKIADDNDNNPIFDISDYSANVWENATVGTSPLTVHAEDLDEGYNSDLVYSLVAPNELFHMDPRTGKISTKVLLTKVALEREQAMCPGAQYCNTTYCLTVCVFEITVSDQEGTGTNRLRDQGRVRINVNDINDHAPSISLNIIQAETGEDARPGQPVAIATITDEDRGPNRQVDFDIISGNDEGLFDTFCFGSTRNQESTCLVRIARYFNETSSTSFTLTVRARDKGLDNRLSSTAQFRITKSASNSHVPVFAEPSYHASVSELEPVGGYVIGLTATDQDMGENGRITYQLSGGEVAVRQFFKINPDTGLVTVNSRLNSDNLDIPTINLSVTARDHGSTVLTSSASLSIDIVDENDEVPEFTQSSYHVNVIEGTRAHRAIITLEATDSDKGLNGSVRYKLESETYTRYGDLFSIGSESGLVSLKRDLDREQQDLYELGVVAYDLGPIRSLSSTVTLTITVTDFNDHAPVFYPVTYYRVVPATAEPGYLVTAVSATDLDAGANGRVSYRVKAGGSSGLPLAVDATTGEIRTTSALSVGASYEMKIQALDGSGVISEIVATVQITVANPTEPDFEFTNSTYSVTIDEDRQDERLVTGKNVIQVRIPNTALVYKYHIADGDALGVFTINQNSGQITTRAALDREIRDTYRLTVIAKGISKLAQATVIVRVRDLNDNDPAFDQSEYAIPIPEDSPIGSVAFVAQASDADAAENGDVTYSLSGQTVSDMFSIDGVTGAVSLQRKVTLNQPYTMEVTATDGGSPQRSTTALLNITVYDVNDHSPVFNPSRIHVSVNESDLVNSRFLTLQATDLDQGDNARLTYSIAGGVNSTHPEFGLFPDGSLYIARKLDREYKDRYQIIVQAQDHGFPQREATAVVEVQILDTNDNEPEFHQELYEFRVLEGQEQGAYIGSVSAQDADTGRNADIMYRLSEKSSLFSINPFTGELRSKAVFDRERNSSFSFAVQAVDNGMTQLHSEAHVTVNVDDINDNAPEFTLPHYEASVSEDASVGTPVYPISASDRDYDLNGIVQFSILSGNELSKFSINPDSGSLTVQGFLNREDQETYNLVIQASDLGDPSQKANVTVRIHITDVNEFAPVFSESSYTANVREDFPIGQPIIRLSATDQDSGANAIPLFSFVYRDESEKVFSVDENTGDVFLLSPLDMEVKQSYDLQAQVSNLPGSTQSSIVPLTINVLDVNDNAPAFPDNTIAVTVPEDITQQRIVTTMQATDRDKNLANKLIKYSLLDQWPEVQFTINENTGVITRTARELDRETISQYRLTVRATDSALPPSTRLFTDKLIFVEISDVNDNDPTFVTPRAGAVPENSGDDTLVYTAQASDLDAGNNGRVTYGLLSNNNKFSINSQSGEVRLRGGIGSSSVKYEISIRASDQGQTQRSALLNVTIIVTATARSFLQFAMSDSALRPTISESAAINSLVTQLQTNSQGHQSSFFITAMRSNGRQLIDYFSVANGRVVVNRPLDRDLGFSVIDVEVWAIDASASAPNTDKVMLQVTLTDENDTPPKFNQSVVTMSLLESFPVNQVVTTLVATDPDIGDQARIQYSLSDIEFFSIRQSGAITLIRSLDRETRPVHRLIVSASDGIHTSAALLRITLLDVNDEPPTFGSPFYSFVVSEAASVGTRVGRVTATDGDTGAGGEIRYELVQDAGLFEVDSLTGVVTLAGQLDYGQTQLYVLHINATDLGTPSLSSTVILYVNVEDVNNNEPIFTPSAVSVAVSEDMGLYAPFAEISADDADEGDNGEVNYSMLTFGTPFNIYPNNGSLYLHQTLNREVKDTYFLEVVASDSAPVQYRLSSTAQVTVQVLDVNDETPVFPEPHIVHISEHTNLGVEAARVEAMDGDLGDNSKLSYSLLSNMNMFDIESNTGVIKLSQHLDREDATNHTVLISVRDLGTPSLSSSALFTVIVEEYNDHPPLFDVSQPRSVQIREDQVAGETILQLRAADADTDNKTGLASEIRYYIVAGDPNEDFHLDQYSGQLSVARAVDYERTKVYTLTIQAEDLGEPRLYSTIDITVSVQDWNDSPPVFLHSPYYVYLQEESSSAINLIQVTAVDADSPPYDTITYNLEFGLDDLSDATREIFSIDESTGVVSAGKAVDREQVQSYRLVVVARNYVSGSQTLTSKADINIMVNDINDHAPEFNLPIYSTSVAEDISVGAQVIQVTATDADIGDNAEVRYILVNDTDAESFTINPLTGWITTETPLDREQQAQFTLRVIAYDLGSPSQHAEIPVFIRLLDVNDETPTFPPDDYSIQVPETLQAGDFIIGATAIDSDFAENGTLTYGLTGADANLFRVSSNGVVTVRSSTTRSRSAQIVVTATDGGGLTASHDVSISFISIQPGDMPSISPSSTTVTIQDTELPPRAVRTIQASPRTSGAVISFRIAGGNVDNVFAINNQGEISQVRPVDHSRTASYELWIEAKDSKNSALRSYARITVNIIDANNHAPEFVQDLYIASTLEQQSIVTPIEMVKVQAVDLDGGNNGIVTYSIVSGNEPDSPFILSSDGSLQLIKQLDREVKPRYDIIIDASDPQGLNSTTTVIIHVEDINDNFPRFVTTYRWTVSEDAPIGYVISAVQAVDADTGDNSLMSYSLSNTNVPFDVTSTGNVTVKSKLDREQTPDYEVLIQAVDQNGAGLSSIATVVITVEDVNDNRPQFKPTANYNFTFTELQDVGSLVGRVVAVDRDLANTSNSQVRFRLVSPSSFFLIDSHTGQITSKRELRYDATGTHNRFTLLVEAHDMGTPSYSETASVEIYLQDANDHAPVFTPSNGYFTAVPYNLNAGTLLLRVEALDLADYGRNAEVSYAAIGGNGSSLLGVGSTNGSIYLKSSLAARQGQYLSVQVRASDAGAPVQSSTTIVTALVTNINRNSPQWVGGSNSFTYTLLESASIGALVGTLRATDSDSGVNADLIYSISDGDPDGLFQIDPESGRVTVAKQLDYEKTQTHRMTITVKDRAFRPRQAFGTLIVNVADVDDSGPVFTSDHYTAHVLENRAPTVDIITVSAPDADQGDNGVVRYSLIGDQEAKNLFSIDTTTGVISTLATFDYEDKSSYSLIVRAFNPHSAAHSNITRVTVLIDSANEFMPRFSERSYNFDVSESAESGTVVGSLIAADADSGSDGVLEFYLTGVSAGFKVHRYTGELIVADRLDRESGLSIVLTALVKNPGPVKGNETDTAMIYINLDDANDAPQFGQANYTASVSENRQTGTPVITVTATDSDQQVGNRDFTYSLGTSFSKFSINSRSGLIITTDELDRESRPSYPLVVRATDQGSPPLSTQVIVYITVADTNDNPPHFVPAIPVGSIAENSDAGTKVSLQSGQKQYLNEVTFDDDLAPNKGPYRYTTTSDLFFVDENNGAINSLVSSLDYEGVKEYVLPVTVTDIGGMSGNLAVKIMITDVNDQPSLPRNLTISVQRFGELKFGVIGNVEPLDGDTVGNYSCSMTIPSQVFSTGTGCILSARNAPPRSAFTVIGSDGIHESVQSNVSVVMNDVTNATLENAVVIQFQGITPGEFLQHPNAIKELEALTTAVQSLKIISMRQSGDYLDVYIAIQDQSTGQYKSNLAQHVRNRLASIQRAGVQISQIVRNVCEADTCSGKGSCSSKVTLYEQLDFASSDGLTLTYHIASLTPFCECERERIGEDCSQQAGACSTRPCMNGATCRPDLASGDYECMCTQEWTGDLCDQDVNECALQNTCLNGATCINQDGGFECQCTRDFFGRRCEQILTCDTRNPCLNNAHCIDISTGGYSCSCKFGYYGPHCEQTSVGFEEDSYMKFNSLNVDSNMITMTLATKTTDGLLLYQAGENGEFAVLQIKDGDVQFIFNTGGQTRQLTVNKAVTDGSWFRVSAHRLSNSATLSITGCLEPSSCDSNEERSTLVLSGDGSLDTGARNILVGGIDEASFSTLRTISAYISVASFTGCLAEVVVDGQAAAQASYALLDSCPVSETQKLCQGNNRCGANGTCVADWFNAECDCDTYFTTVPCYKSVIAAAISLPSDAFISYKFRPSYRRSTLLSAATRRRRDARVERATPAGSIFTIGLRSAKNGVLMQTLPENPNTVLKIFEGRLSYGSLENPVKISDGEWHDVTLTVSATRVYLAVDGLSVNQTATPADSFMNLATVEEIVVSGEGFQGCLRDISLNGDSLPMSEARTDMFEITVSNLDSDARGCDGCPVGVDVCEAGKRCSATEGIAQCVRNAENAGGMEPWMLAVIAVCSIVFVFSLILAAVFLTRYLKRQKEKQQRFEEKASSLPIVKHDSSRSRRGHEGRDHLDGGHTNLTDAEIMASERPPSRSRSRGPTSSVSPGALKQIATRTVPSPYQQLEDSTVIIEGSVTGGNAGGTFREQYYDFDEAASIAPSDVDIRKYYKGYRSGDADPNMIPLHMRPSEKPSRSSPANANPGSARESPYNRAFAKSPLARNSPANVLHEATIPPRQQETPISQLNQRALRATPIDELNRRIQMEKRVQCHDSESSMTDGSTIKQPQWSQAPKPSSRPNSRQAARPGSRNQTPVTLSISAQRQQDLNRLSHRSMSSSMESEDEARRKQLDPMDRNIYSEAADSSSDESSNDSFTASEFEPDEPKVRNDYQLQPQNMMFTKLQEVEDESDNGDPNAYRMTYSWEALRNVTNGTTLQPYIHGNQGGQSDSNTDNDSITKGRKAPSLKQWDYLLTWGPSFEKLVGVCTDIAELPNDDPDIISTGYSDPSKRPSSEEYV